MRISEADWKRLPPHPRLFAPPARIAALKKQTDTTSQQLLVLLERDAEEKLSAPPIEYPPTGFLFEPVRMAQGRILTLALQYRLCGDKRFLERAKAELLRLADLPEWRPSHFLDTGEAALAAGIGLDWLYDDLSPSERDRIARAIVQNALVPSLDAQEGGWVNGDFNWNQVCHAGLTVGALVIAEREPELARTVVERAVQNVPKAEASYAPMGAYPEGPSYWSYGTTFQVFLIEALRSAFGSSFGLGTSPGFLRTADWVLQMVGPTGDEYNFSDYDAENRHDPVLLWFARQRKAGELAHGEQQALARMATKAPNAPKQSRHLAFALLWWEGELPKSQAELPRAFTASGGKLPIAVMRSAWNDPNATFVAVKGGHANGSHAHMDAGSFIMEAGGVRWAVDLGTENYSVMRAAKIDLWNTAQNSSRWTTFRVGPDGHNLLRFNKEAQDVNGVADVRVLPPEDGVTAGTVVDLSPLYPLQVVRAERRVRLFGDQSVGIEDEWTTGAQPATAAWQWLTRAQVSQDKNGVLLHQAGQSLRLTIPATATVAIENVSRPKNAQDSPNPGLTRIVVTLAPTPGHTTATLRVKAFLQQGNHNAFTP